MTKPGNQSAEEMEIVRGCLSTSLVGKGQVAAGSLKEVLWEYAALVMGRLAEQKEDWSEEQARGNTGESKRLLVSAGLAKPWA